MTNDRPLTAPWPLDAPLSDRIKILCLLRSAPVFDDALDRLRVGLHGGRSGS